MVDLSQLQKVKSESEVKYESDRQEAIRYLRETDWYVTRNIEIGKEIPDAVSALRAQARSKL